MLLHLRAHLKEQRSEHFLLLFIKEQDFFMLHFLIVMDFLLEKEIGIRYLTILIVNLFI